MRLRFSWLELGGTLLFGALALGPGVASAEDWTAVSNTAMSITGDISLEDGALIFENGASLSLGEPVDLPHFRAGGAAVDAVVFPVPTPADPVLLNGNTLCGTGKVTYVAYWDLDATRRMLAMFTDKDMPAGEDGLCASYAYEVSN